MAGTLKYHQHHRYYYWYRTRYVPLFHRLWKSHLMGEQVKERAEQSRKKPNNVYMTRHTDPIYGNAMTVLVEVILKCPARWFFFCCSILSLLFFLSGAQNARGRFYLQVFDIRFVVLIHINASHADAHRLDECSNSETATTNIHTPSNLTEHGINIRWIAKWNKASMICFYCSSDELWNGSNERAGRWTSERTNWASAHRNKKNGTVFAVIVAALSYRMCLIRHECH